MQWLPEHRLALAKQGNAAEIITIPKGQFAIVQQRAVLDHRVGMMLPGKRSDVGSHRVLGPGVRIARQGGDATVEQLRLDEVRRREAPAEKHDGISCGQRGEG